MEEHLGWFNYINYVNLMYGSTTFGTNVHQCSGSIPPVSKHLHPAYDPGHPPALWSSEFQCRSLRTSHLGGEGQIQDSNNIKIDETITR